MAQKIQKTNVCRLLDAAGIAYELIEYKVDEKKIGGLIIITIGLAIFIMAAVKFRKTYLDKTR